MGLKDRYQAAVTGAPLASPAPAPASAAPSTPPTASATPAASAAVSSSSPAVASAATTIPSPASPAAPTLGGGRDLAAVRAALARRASPGVNPPESKIPETAFDRTTAEGPDGSLVLLPNHQEVLKAVAKAGGSGSQSAPSPEPTTSVSEAGGLSRGQKAAATRAANKAKASAPPAESPAAPAVSDTASTGSDLDGFTTEQLLAEIIRRAARA